jgi:hypothetical protein
MKQARIGSSFSYTSSERGQDLKIITRTPEGLEALLEFGKGVMRWLCKPRDPVSLHVSAIEPLTVFDLSDVFSLYGNVTSIRMLSDINKEDDNPIYGHAAIITIAPKSDQSGIVEIPTRLPVQSRLGDNCVVNVSYYTGGQRFGNGRRSFSPPNCKQASQNSSLPTSPASATRIETTHRDMMANVNDQYSNASLALSNFPTLVEAASSNGIVDGKTDNGTAATKAAFNGNGNNNGAGNDTATVGTAKVSNHSNTRLSDMDQGTAINGNGSTTLSPSILDSLVEATTGGPVDGAAASFGTTNTQISDMAQDPAIDSNGSGGTALSPSILNPVEATTGGTADSAARCLDTNQATVNSTTETSNDNNTRPLSCFDSPWTQFRSLREYGFNEPFLPNFISSPKPTPHMMEKWSNELKYAYQQYEKFDDIYRNKPSAVISLRPVLKSFVGKKKPCLTCGTSCRQKLAKWEFLGIIYATASFCSDECMAVPLLADPDVGLSPPQFLMLFGGTPEDYVLVSKRARKIWRESGSEWSASALPGLVPSLGSRYEGFRSLLRSPAPPVE